MVTDVRSKRREPHIRQYRVVFQRTWILNSNAISDSVRMSKPVTHRPPVILIYVITLFRMRVAAVGNHALFISKELDRCFSNAGPRPGTGPWHQLHRAARGSPGSCHFSSLSIFMNKYFIVEIFQGEQYSWMCRKAHFISPVTNN